MPDDLGPLSSELRGALGLFAARSVQEVHRLQVGLARLLLAQAPPTACSQLELALAFIEGRAGAAELADARQDCWTYVGSLSCGCSLSDSVSAHAIMTCLETSEAAHSLAALAEQVERVRRCGVDEARILEALRAGELL